MMMMVTMMMMITMIAMMTTTRMTTLALTGKLHLVVDDTEAEHVRVGHQHFLVLDDIAIKIIIVINLTVIIIEKCRTFQHCHQKRFHYRDQTLSG